MTIGLFIALCVLPAFLISVIATEIVRRLALRWNFVDRPTARKVHQAATPLGGGIAIWVGTVVPLLGAALVVWWLSSNAMLPRWLPLEWEVHFDGVGSKTPQLLMVLLAGTLLAIVGLLDDRLSLPWAPRLACQFIAGLLVVSSGIRLTLFIDYPWFGMLVTLFWIALLVNSFNFLDNMNGLSSGIALIAAVFLAVISLTMLAEPRWFVAGTMLVLAGAIAGFWVHNWNGRIFMGDAGSYFIGLLIATITAAATFYDSRLGSRHVVMSPLCVLAIPLYDFASVMVIRLAQRRSPFHPDKSHFSHRLVELGLTPKRAVSTIYLATFTTGLAALALYEVPGWGGAAMIVMMVACLLSIIAILESTALRNAKRGKKS